MRAISNDLNKKRQMKHVGRSPEQPFADERGVIVFAHRGGSYRWPENTMLAFAQAATLGVDGLELDIHGTRDGELVVIHDGVVDRVTNGTGAVRDFTLAELKKLDAGYRWSIDGGSSFPFRGKGITIPTLAEVFAAFPKLWINIDIKQAEPSIVRPFVSLIHDYGMEKLVCAGSFHNSVVRQFRAFCPQAATAASLLEARLLFLLNRLRLPGLFRGRATAMQLPERSGRTAVVTRSFVRAAHRRGVAVHVWTVNDIPQMRRLLAMGVDGLMTDYPDILLKMLGRL